MRRKMTNERSCLHRTPPTYTAMKLLHVLFSLIAVCRWPGLCTGKKKLLETLNFDIKPSGQITHQTAKLENGVTCVFTYAAVGGTNEDWSMSLQKTGKTAYTCKIERPDQASYLYFMSFAVSILEHQVEKIDVFDNTGALLQDEDYEVTTDGKSVQHKEDGFQSNLARLVLVAKRRDPREL